MKTSTKKTSLSGTYKNIVFLFAFLFVWTACSDQSDVKVPSMQASSSATIDATTAGSTSQSFPASTVTLTDGSKYSVGSVVTWYGSSTTWTYTVTALLNDAGRDSKNISHVSLFGFDNCFTSNLTDSNVPFMNEGETGCLDKSANVIKYDGGTYGQRTMVITYHFNKALHVNPAAATMYVKAGSTQGGANGGCESVSIPGPSCEELAVSGNVSEKVCVDSQTTEQPVAGKTVTAAQGSVVYTATTDENGNYSFSNLGGEWVISVEGADDQLASLGPDDASVSFMLDSRPNGSCATIIGTVTILECFQQSSVSRGFEGVTVSCEHAEYQAQSGGSFRFDNVSPMMHEILVENIKKSVSVMSENGVYDAGNIIIDRTNGGVCGNGPVECSLSQGYWFAKPQAVWPAGSVTIGGKSYTQEEGKAIWATSNSRGLLNAKAAFLQASAIKLSNVAETASVWADVQIIDNYLASIAKLTPATIPANSRTGANAAAGAAAGRIGQWIDANHCAE